MKHMQLYNITQNQQIIGPNPACCAWFFFGVCLRCHQIVSWNSQWFYAMTMNPWSLSMHQGTALRVQVGKWTSCSHDSLGSRSWKPLWGFLRRRPIPGGASWVTPRFGEAFRYMGPWPSMVLRISKKKIVATQVADVSASHFNLPSFEMSLLYHTKPNQLQKSHTPWKVDELVSIKKALMPTRLRSS